ncbi:DUF3014 domain-containing protein [Psychrobium sp. 1_MG-2023]|uniref:DUF3014 domain-containing protein n=1 Tax=Psychrobium sp. 1_MG-2023 TaxID=3062624 RepID=UPI000C335421|nr:DUF3014 domain-containing protein [Psychrobium sp. 1_MG-2023]MDP2562834.1 DUF3014 domain-containing protein [Psychrobium sp. 1_MG-2023]PKF57948.1 DUF3014 domain-containing protein [Alteromonadales bacterium alter-6D02]
MQQSEQSEQKNSMMVYIIAAVILIGTTVGVILYNSTNKAPEISEIPDPEPVMTESVYTPEPELEPEPMTQEAIDPVETPEMVEQPQPEIVTPPPLPSLEASDPVVLEKTLQLSWLPQLSSTLLHKDILLNFVTFTDNFSRGDLATKFSPINKPNNKFSVYEVDNEIYLDEASYQRYSHYVDIINSLNIDLAVKHYQYLMPLINQAYSELGYPDDSFNDTLISAIEVMLDAPTIREPIKLIAPSAMYKFADSELESLPAAQKLMLRMGPENTTKLRPKLQQIQRALSEL